MAQMVTEDVLDYGYRHWADSPDTAENLYNNQLSLGDIYRRLGKLPDAEALIEGARVGLSSTYGDLVPSSLTATNALGQLYEQIGLYDAAEPLLRQAVAGFEQVFGLELKIEQFILKTLPTAKAPLWLYLFGEYI